MPPALVFWISSLTYLLIYIEDCCSISVPESVEVIISVSNYFRSRCIYFMETSDSNISGVIALKVELIKRQKLLSARNIGTSNLQFLDYLSEEQCRRNRRIIITQQSEAKYLKDIKGELMSDNIWLLFLNKKTSLEEFFTGINIPFDCEFLVAQTGDNEVVVLTEVYRVSASTPLQTYRFGNWKENEGLNGPDGGLYDRRNNLEGLVLRTGLITKLCTPQSLENCQKSNPTEFFVFIWKLLETELKFKSEYYRPEDDAYGSRNENGSWSGLIRMLLNNEADAVCADLSVTLPRKEVVDYTVPILDVRFYLIIRKSDIYALKWNSFLAPLSMGLWQTVACLVILCSLILAGTSRVLQIYKFQKDDKFNFPTSLFLTVGIFFSQDHPLRISSASLRIIFLTLHLTALILLSSYSASLISYLTVRNPELPFTNFNEFLKDGTYKLLTPGDGAELSMFKDSKTKRFRDIYEKMIKPHENDLPDGHEEGTQRMCSKTKYAYLATSIILSLMKGKLNCTLTTIPDAFFPASQAIAMKKNSPYLGIFNYRLQKMRRDGIFNSQAVLSPKYKARDTVTLMVPSIKIAEFLPILCLLGLGVFISCLMLFAEICIRKATREKDIQFYYKKFQRNIILI